MHKEITQELPTSLKLLLCYRKTHTIIALVIFIVGAIFSTIKLWDFDFREFSKLNGDTAVTNGIVTNSYFTGITETIGDDEGYYYINAYVYEYKVNNEDHKWISYSRKYIKTGDKVSIYYNVDSPQYSVIKDFRYRANGTAVLYLLIFPIVSLLILLFHVYKGIKYLYIINNGIITKGTLTEKDVLYELNFGTYYKLSFVFYSDKNKKIRHTSTIRTTIVKSLLDENKETIIFHKNNPYQSLLLDDLASPISKYIKKNWY